VGRYLGKYLPAFGSPAEYVAVRTFRIRRRARHSSRPHGWGETNFLVEHDRFSRHNNQPVPLTQRFSSHRRYPPCVGYIPHPVRHAPHFFSRTASSRGFFRKTEWFPVPTRGTSLRFTTSSVSQAHRPAPGGFRGGPHASARCVADAGASSKAAFPAVARSIQRPFHAALPIASGWSAIPVFGLTPRSGATWRWIAPRPVAAGPKPQHRRTGCNHSATSAATVAVPAWIAEPLIAPSCPSYKTRTRRFKQVSICITIYVVTVLELLSHANPVWTLRGIHPFGFAQAGSCAKKRANARHRRLTVALAAASNRL